MDRSVFLGTTDVGESSCLNKNPLAPASTRIVGEARRDKHAYSSEMTTATGSISIVPSRVAGWHSINLVLNKIVEVETLLRGSVAITIPSREMQLASPRIAPMGTKW